VAAVLLVCIPILAHKEVILFFPLLLLLVAVQAVQKTQPLAALVEAAEVVVGLVPVVQGTHQTLHQAKEIMEEQGLLLLVFTLPEEGVEVLLLQEAMGLLLVVVMGEMEPHPLFPEPLQRMLAAVVVEATLGRLLLNLAVQVELEEAARVVMELHQIQQVWLEPLIQEAVVVVVLLYLQALL
jgi:hypothetical protein